MTALEDEAVFEQPRQEAKLRKLKDADRISFRVDDAPVTADAQVQAWWADYRKTLAGSADVPAARCLITGQPTAPLATLPVISGLQAVGGHSRGEALFCFDIQNRYEFIYYVACSNGNPNGDPDMGNAPRLDPETMQGYITDISTKRRIRNYIQTAFAGQPGMNIIIQQSTNINRHIAEARREAGVEGAKDKNAVYAGRKKACQMFYDVRTFGAVMSTGPNAGQVRGPVQLTFGKSLDPVLPLDISITRMAATLGDKDKTLADYVKAEENADEDSLRTMGRKQLIPFGLYEVRGFISANLAAETGFDEADLNALFEAILNMYDHDRSASKGEMDVVSPLILFKHVGTDTDEAQRARQAKLGCAPAHRLFELVQVRKKPEIAAPRSYLDYTASVALSKVPNGIAVGFKSDAFSPIVWNQLPEDETWFTADNG